MNKKVLLLIILAVAIMVLPIAYWTNSQIKGEFISVDGIENFSPNVNNSAGDYLLFYPTDWRVSQEYTLVKEVTKTGKEVKKYKIIDDEFTRMIPNQKPNNMNQLYLSFFGDAEIDNYYFTYDIQNNSFKKVELNYFDYKVGIDHLAHYGNDIIFQTNTSHKTGDQNYDEKSGGFNVSVSNATTQKSFETEYNRSPAFTPILHFREKIIYGTNATLGDNDNYEEHGIAIADIDKGSVRYETFGTKNVELIPVFSTNEHAYIIGDNGNMYVYDQDLQYKTYKPFKNLPKQQYYDIQGNGQLALDEQRILYCLRGIGEEDKYSLGVLNLKDEPVFEIFNEDFANTESWYEPLYQNVEEKEIYIKERSNNKKNNNIIVMDSESLNVKVKFPASYNHLLDLVVKIK